MRPLRKALVRAAARICPWKGDRAGGSAGRTGAFRILMYHSVGAARQDDRIGIRVTPENFRLQMRFLHDNGYTVIALGDLIPMLDPGRSLPARTVAITFDDGYRDTLIEAAPVLNGLRFPATVFICMGYVAGTARDPRRYWSLWDFMSCDDLRAISALGFDIGLHSMTHAPLGTLTTDEALREIRESRSALERCIGREVSLFSYPHGSFNDRVIGLLRENRFAAACSSIRGINDACTDRFKLRRTEIAADDTIEDFKMKMKGCYD